MSFYTDASLVLIPSGIKDQKVYCAKPVDGSGDLTFSRASNATRVNSSGLVEKVRTNEIPYSQDFDNVAWIKGANGTGVNPVVTANNATAPDGTLTADTIVFDAGAGTTTGDSSVVYQSITATGLCTASFYARVTSGTGQLVFRSVAGSTYTTANLTTTWQRFSAAETGSSGFLEIGIRRGLSNEPINASVTAELWGAQLETGDIATDYIATTTAAVSVGPVSGLPRLDYLNSSCPRLLLEPQRTNIQLNSESFDNATWTKTNSVVTANQIASPDGYVNADKLDETTANNIHQLESSRSVTSGSTYTMSVFAKKGERNFVRLYEDSYSNSAYFNLNTGVLGTISGPTASAKIEDYGNGWYRCSVTYTETANTFGRYRIVVAKQDNETSYAGTAGYGIYIYGAQYELGAYATSYIPTLSTAVTRVADEAYKTSITSLIGQTEGTIFIDFAEFSDNAHLITLGDGTAANYIMLYINGSSIAWLSNGGLTGSAGTVTANSKAALAYKGNDSALYLNGVQILTDTSSTIPSLPNIYLNNNAVLSNINKLEVKQVLLFKTRLSNASLASLTTL